MAILASRRGNLKLGRVLRRTESTVWFLEDGQHAPSRIFLKRDPRRVFDTIREALNWMYTGAAEHVKDLLLEQLATDFPDTAQHYSPEVFADWLSKNLGG